MLGKEEMVTIKGKRTKRSRSDVDSPPPPAADQGHNVVPGISLTNSSSLSCNNSVELRDSSATLGEDEDMANCLILLAKGDDQKPQPTAPAGAGVYQCKTCSKSFHSFQALGGHRASHTKPNKPPPQPPVVSEKRGEHLSPNHGESTILSLRIPSGNSGGKTVRVHECTICGAEFASGQALGGHMRRHRPIPVAADGKRPRNDHLGLSLDLNLPAPEDHDVQRESKFPFPAKQVIVFSASPMVDCHY